MTRWVLRAEGRPNDIELPDGCARDGAYRHAREWAAEIDATVQILVDEDGEVRHIAAVRPWQQVDAERQAAQFARFESWLRDELRDAGCEIRTLSPEGMAQVTVRRMREQGWTVTAPQDTTAPTARAEARRPANP